MLPDCRIWDEVGETWNSEVDIRNCTRTGFMLMYNCLTRMHCLQGRLSEAARLAQEMAVQAAAIEAARSNVEHHYTYICTHFREFMAWYVSSP